MNRRRIILKAIYAVLGVTIVLFIIHCWLIISTDSYISALKAKGEPMELTEVIPPSTPVKQNGAPHLIAALTNQVTENITTNNLPKSLTIAVPGKAVVDWKQSDIRSLEGTNTWEQLGTTLADAETNLASYRQATNFTVLDFQLDYQNYWKITLPHLESLRQAAEWLSVSAIYNLHQGDTAEACADVHAMLAIVKGMTKEPLEYSQQIRMDILFMSADTTWEILQNANIFEDGLEMLQRDWESLEIMKPVERAYLMERIQEIRVSRHYRENPDELWRWVTPDLGIPRFYAKYYWGWFATYSDEKRAAQIYQTLVEATRLAETNHSFQISQSFIDTNFVRLGFKTPEPSDGGMRMDLDDDSVFSMCSDDAYLNYKLFPRSFAAETTRNLVVAAIAIHRYESQHSQPPVSLWTLKPKLLNVIPIDWMNGKPLCYRSNSDGTFLLYSVGYNGVDDKGDSTMPAGVKNYFYYWQNFDARDWVWPQPATADEIQKYYADQAVKAK